MTPFVSVIVLNWNGEALLAECLDSLTAQTYPRVEILVVDNGSADGSVRLVRERYGDTVRLIETGANLGFAGGNNVGIAAARGEYILLLNNDAAADPGWVEALVREAETDSRLGMCASKVVTWEGPARIDSAGLLLSRDGLGRGRGRGSLDDGRFGRAEDALLPSGCAALYRRAMFNEVGLFDEAFFMYCEDVDLGLRGRLANWHCRYVPRAIVRHRYSASAGGFSLGKVFLVERNRVWVMLKTFPWSAIALSPWWTLTRLAWHAYADARGRGGAGRALDGVSARALVFTVLRAYWAAARGAPAMLAKRKRGPRAAFRGWFRSYGVSARDVAFTE
ncbi:MAG: glycosyltransferase family 2 protein, partial [Nitrospiria bacterium]